MAHRETSPMYKSVSFGLNERVDDQLNTLFNSLIHLYPMDKNGPMSGNCDHQTNQMEQFLSQTFGFKNKPGEYIVQGVKFFELEHRLDTMNPDTVIYFPSNILHSFAMSVKEIMGWQRSYRVYADQNIQGLNTEFLQRALEGHSKDGGEAFYFAGRKHDVCDILYYITNWREVFEVDPKSDLPFVYNGRDFYPRAKGPPGELHEDRVLHSLMRMVALRLKACDEEGVEVVVETGIGLGVFAGNHIGIDSKIRAFSAKASRKVLEQHGSTYKNIRAVVFALPIFNKSGSKHSVPDTYDDYVNEFEQAKYNGPIPVLIADQDMHRLTVAIARLGFKVSELNPADSHGVFGEYWQNRGPAVEEKLALTTVGLLVQHHLINPHVLNTDNYRLLIVDKELLVCPQTTIDDIEVGRICCSQH
ncbi:unnamed protein product [Rotaria socialis]|uniref:Uncharacterized protein n=1 Tax=Rotaria socialis TaxID=392032 RepID=A0A820ZDT2_9BILA|nr:unnamed protein product [Rotaria socialis]